MLNIVIPMAGAGSRFAKVGYRLPKPLIPVHGVPMVRLVIDNLRPSRPHRFIFVCQAAHLPEFGLETSLRKWAGENAQIVTVDGLTQGAACSVLMARRLIDSDEPLMIANSDQYLDMQIDAYLKAIEGYDGALMTMPASDPKWSYVERDAMGKIVRVVEKQVVSEEATVGVYNFRRGSDFVALADQMIAANARENGEFYVAPVYSGMARAGGQIGTYSIGDGMHGIGTPDDLGAFLKLSLSVKATQHLVEA